MDEAMYAGGRGANNTSYYLYNGQEYWTMSPCNWGGGRVDAFFVRNDGYLNSWNVNTASYGLRPVINLKFDTVISSGNGTIDSPYIVTD